jgi:hypothetical protein
VEALSRLDFFTVAQPCFGDLGAVIDRPFILASPAAKVTHPQVAGNSTERLSVERQISA